MPPRPVAALVLLCLIGNIAMSVTADEPKKYEPRTLSVTGYGKISAPPNLAEINVGVITQAATAKLALASNSEKMAALQSVLKERGVASKDIQTTQISVQPQYSQPPRIPPNAPQQEFVPRIVGYQVQNSVQITGRDLAKLGELLDTVVTAGANQMYGITFRIDEPDSLLDVARKKAMADARKKAELMAGEAGVVVGPPLSIRDEATSFPNPPPPMVGFRAAMAPAPSVPVAAGEQELGVTVYVVYEIKDPK